MNVSDSSMKDNLSERLIGHHRLARRSLLFFNGRLWIKTNWWRFALDFYHVIKRGSDCLIAGILLLLLSPLLLLVALAIRLESPGPVLFHQERIGYRGEPFRFWKFRSMYLDAEKRRVQLEQSNEMHGGVLFKMKKDPRITRVGRFIRKFSIDELPQLWNVICGEMALVGPRPALPSEVARYSLADRRRLDVKPGITCIWQVSGRSDIPFEQQIKMDVRYIFFQSVSQDLKILLRTIPAVVTGRGAY